MDKKMKTLLILACTAFTQSQALEYEVQFENNQVSVSRVVIEPKEEIGLHRDAAPQIVIGLRGGTITRLEADGREIDVAFPTGKAVYRPVDPENELHRSVNRSNAPIEMIIVQLKNN
jgi:quercetin dioxygenase-like cupin family protein